jgi:hypothetical protein
VMTFLVANESHPSREIVCANAMQLLAIPVCVGPEAVALELVFEMLLVVMIVSDPGIISRLGNGPRFGGIPAPV